MRTSSNRILSRSVLAALGLLTAITSVGCQVDVGGQTLPSPYWMTDDVQYFPAGPEFKLSREAAALKAFEAQKGLPTTVITPSGVVEELPVAPVDVDAALEAEGIAP